MNNLGIFIVGALTGVGVALVCFVVWMIVGLRRQPQQTYKPPVHVYLRHLIDRRKKRTLHALWCPFCPSEDVSARVQFRGIQHGRA